MKLRWQILALLGMFVLSQTSLFSIKYVDLKYKDIDLYAVLGLKKDADLTAIKKAFKKLAVQWHPDKNPGNTAAVEKFKAIQEAYEILGDPKFRKEYDDLRGGKVQAAAAQPASKPTGIPDEKLLPYLQIIEKNLAAHIKNVAPDKKGIYPTYKEGLTKEYTWMQMVVSGMRAISQASQAPNFSPLGSARNKVLEQLETLVTAILGDDGDKFMALVQEVSTKYVSFYGKDEKTLQAILDNVQRYRAKTLFKCQKDVDDLYSILLQANAEKIIGFFSVFKDSLAKIMYVGPEEELSIFKVFAGAYTELVSKKLPYLGQKISDDEFITITRQLLKAFNAWIKPTAGLSSEQQTAAQEFNEKVIEARTMAFEYIVKYHLRQTLGYAEANKIDDMVQAMQPLFEKPDEITLESFKSVTPEDPNKALIELFEQHVTNIEAKDVKKPYPLYGGKSWQELITELVQKAETYDAGRLSDALQETFKELVKRYLTVVSKGADKFDTTWDKDEKGLDDTIAAFQALRKYLAGDNTKDIKKYLPMIDDLKELVPLTIIKYKDEKASVLNEMFQIAGFSYSAVPSSLKQNVLQKYFLAGYNLKDIIDEKTALSNLSESFMEVLQKLVWIKGLGTVQKIKKFNDAIDAWTFPADYKFPKGVWDKDELKKSKRKELLENYVKYNIPGDSYGLGKADDEKAQEQLVAKLDAFVDKNLATMTDNSFDKFVEENTPIGLRLYGMISSFGDDKTQLHVIPKGKIVVDKKEVEISQYFTDLQALYSKASDDDKKAERWGDMAFKLYGFFKKLVPHDEDLLKDCSFDGVYASEYGSADYYFIGVDYSESNSKVVCPVYTRLRDAEEQQDPVFKKFKENIEKINHWSSRLEKLIQYLLGKKMALEPYGQTHTLYIINQAYLEGLLAQLAKNYTTFIQNLPGAQAKTKYLVAKNSFEWFTARLNDYFMNAHKKKYPSGWQDFKDYEFARQAQEANNLLNNYADFDNKKAAMILAFKKTYFGVIKKIKQAVDEGIKLLAVLKEFDKKPAADKDPTLNTLWQQMTSFVGQLNTQQKTLEDEIAAEEQKSAEPAQKSEPKKPEPTPETPKTEPKKEEPKKPAKTPETPKAEPKKPEPKKPHKAQEDSTKELVTALNSLKTSLSKLAGQLTSLTAG